MNTGEAVRLRILELMEKSSLTVYGLIMNAGMPPSTVKSIMKGKARNPRVCTITVICTGLNISVREFYDSELFDGLNTIEGDGVE